LQRADIRERSFYAARESEHWRIVPKLWEECKSGANARCEILRKTACPVPILFTEVIDTT